jgi:hypothetical protein
MTWEDLKRQKEDSIRESTGNPMSESYKKGDKIYSSFSEYLNSDEYKEMLNLEAKLKAEYKVKAKEYFKSLSEDDQLLMFFHVTNSIFENYYIDKRSYRGLLYDKFGFSTDSYSLGMDSGMFAIHNDLTIPEDREEMLRLIVKHFNLELDPQQLYALRYILHNICLPNLKMKDMIYGQLAFDFDELPE